MEIKKGLNEPKIEKMAEKILNTEEYYSAEDYGNFLSLQTYLQTNKGLEFLFTAKINMNENNKITRTTIRANFLVDMKPKEVFIEKKKILKIYAICKIYSEDNKYIKILINRAEKYDVNEILKKLNDNRIFKGAIKINLNIDEYPIRTYHLEEKLSQNIDNNAEDEDDKEKEFILKKNNSLINLSQNTLSIIDINSLNLRETSRVLDNRMSNPSNNNNINSLNNNMSINSNLNQNNNNRTSIYNNNIQVNNNINNNNNNINNNNINNINIYNINNINNNNNNINNNYNNINNNNININNNMNLQNNSNDNNNIINNNMNILDFIQNLYNILEMNNQILQLIINYINQNSNNNSQMNNNLIIMINNLIKLNKNIPIDYNNIYIMHKNIYNLLDFLNQLVNNNINQMSNNNINQMGNNNINQMVNNNNNKSNNYLQQIIKDLNQVNNNLNKFKNSVNIQNCINNNINNFQNKNVVDNKTKKEIYNNSIFKEYEYYFPLIGLRNVGLTCYMNSILQCLLHIPQLNAFFINKYPEQKDELKKINQDSETGGRLCEKYHKIVIDILKLQGHPNSYVKPKEFNEFLSSANGQFAQLEANDAKDLLLYLFQAMHAELNYQGDKKLKNVPKCNQLIEKESFNFFLIVNNNLNLSIISYLFYGVHKSSTLCEGCNNILYNFQYFQFLSFPTFNYKDKQFNIYQGFKDFINPEKMSGDNQCYCQNCKGLRDATVVTKIYSAPIYLIINIDYGKNKKYNPRGVTFGGIIDIKDFVDESDKSSNIKYQLIAVSTHIGRSGSSGHYITYCQSYENIWYEFNDSSVTKTEFNKVNSNSPYVLIYKKL